MTCCFCYELIVIFMCWKLDHRLASRKDNSIPIHWQKAKRGSDSSHLQHLDTLAPVTTPSPTLAGRPSPSSSTPVGSTPVGSTPVFLGPGSTPVFFGHFMPCINCYCFFSCHLTLYRDNNKNSKQQ